VSLAASREGSVRNFSGEKEGTRTEAAFEGKRGILSERGLGETLHLEKVYHDQSTGGKSQLTWERIRFPRDLGRGRGEKKDDCRACSQHSSIGEGKALLLPKILPGFARRREGEEEGGGGREPNLEASQREEKEGAKPSWEHDHSRKGN